MPSKLSQFWQELKRRKVFQVVAMYAASAFIILEVADIVLPRLGLPDWTVTFVIILLIIGFPIAVIFSWIFDITPQGVRKTAPIETEEESNVDRNNQEYFQHKKSFQINHAIIIVLLVIVGILVYPKIFKKGTAEIPRDNSGKVSIAVMPFRNLTSDTLFNVWQQGVQNLIIGSLSNSTELSVRQPETMYSVSEHLGRENLAALSPRMGKDIAQKLETGSYIMGSLIKAGNRLRIDAQLRDAISTEIYRTFEVNGMKEEDLILMTDSLSFQIRNYLEIRAFKQYADPDIHSVPATSSALAYRYYTEAMSFFWKLDFENADRLLLKALEIDSTIINAWIFLGWSHHNTGKHREAKEIFNKLYSRIDLYPGYLDRLAIEFPVLTYGKDPWGSINNRKLVLDYDPNQMVVWFQLGWEYFRIQHYEEAIEAFEKSMAVNKAWGGKWFWEALYTRLGMAYHKIGNHTRENEIYELALSISPGNASILYHQAVCAISQGDSARGEQLISRFRSIFEQQGRSVPFVEDWVGFCYQEAGWYTEAKEHLILSIEYNPPDVHSYWAMCDLGRLLIDEGGDPEKALMLIDRTLQAEIDDEELIPELLHQKGRALLQLGDHKEAVENLNRAWDLYPTYSHDLFLHKQEAEKSL
jgi:tetratricopeptide (TPR) repeat protein